MFCFNKNALSEMVCKTSFVSECDLLIQYDWKLCSQNVGDICMNESQAMVVCIRS